MKTSFLTRSAFAFFFAFAISAQAAPRECVFKDLELGQIYEGDTPFEMLEETAKQIDVPEIFSKYVGEMDQEQCKGAVQEILVRSKDDQSVYTFLYTNEDSCDGGNSFGVILSDETPAPNEDKVIATISDSFIDCL